MKPAFITILPTHVITYQGLMSEQEIDFVICFMYNGQEVQIIPRKIQL